MKKGKNSKVDKNKASAPVKGKTTDESLLNREKDEMIDDHGNVIIGGRNRKPRLPEEKEN